MDIQRNLLIAVLVLLSGLLLVNWVEFRDTHQTAGDVANSTVDASSAQIASVPNDVRDVPSPQSDSIKETESNSQLATAKPSAQLVEILTDTLQLKIDLRGGDIVSAALRTHLSSLGENDQPFRLLESDAQRTYVARSGLVGADGTDSRNARPLFHSSRLRYEMRPDEDEISIDLDLPSENGVTVTKRFHLRRGDYLVDVQYLVRNDGLKPWQAAMYAQLERDASPDPGTSGGKLGIQPFLGFATKTPDEPYHRIALNKIEEDEDFKSSLQGGWIAMVQHYFIGAWVAEEKVKNSFFIRQSSTGNYLGGFVGPVHTVAPGASTAISSGFYAGPKDQYRLRRISSGLELTVDYGWLWWLAQPLFALLHFFATGEAYIGDWSFQLGNGFGNWGWSIILLTVTVKLAFFRLSAASYKSMAKMRKLQPKMLEIKERHGSDRQKLSQETMELYRREKVNPLGGCLPILIQMPVFLALYWVLLESVELRHAPFIAWIKDLSVMDPYFVLPLLMGASMFFQQKLNPPPPDPMQAKIFQFMPIIFTVFFLFFPAGLVLYWLVNNLLSITQQWIITRQIEKAS